MLRSVKELTGYAIRATDGDVGKVDDFYFDDHHWVVRYLIVNTGKWLPGRRVLISPQALGQPSWSDKVFPVNLTEEQIKGSPPIEADKPVSRQQELAVRRYFAWPGFGAGQMGFGQGIASVPAPAVVVTKRQERTGDPDLRSTHEVIGYGVEASDGKVGHVEDFLVDDVDWTLRYLIVDTKNWWPGGGVLVAPQWTEAVSWSDKQLRVKLTREVIQKSPPYDPSLPITREYEQKLHESLGQPTYWKE